MRIVQLIPSLDVGGAERMAALLALGLARLGHEVRLISLYNSSGSWIERDCVDQGLPLEFLGKKPGLDPSMVRRLGHSLRQWRPDIVHSHLHSLKYLLPARGFWRRCRVVHTVHNLAQHEIELHGRLIHHLAFRSGVVPVAIGAAVAQSLREVYRIPIHESIPNGIPVAAYAPPPGARQALRAELALDDHTPMFLSAGRLNPQKDHAGLIDAFARQPHGRLYIAGEGELREALEQQIQRAGLSQRVVLLGVRRDMPRWMAAADAFVLSSRYEGNPLVVMEAMAAGLPVVATAVGCVPELVMKDTGILVPPGDPQRLAEALDRLGADLPMARRLGLAGARVAADRFDVAAMAAAYAALYGRLLPVGVRQ